MTFSQEIYTFIQGSLVRVNNIRTLESLLSGFKSTLTRCHTHLEKTRPIPSQLYQQTRTYPNGINKIQYKALSRKLAKYLTCRGHYKINNYVLFGTEVEINTYHQLMSYFIRNTKTLIGRTQLHTNGTNNYRTLVSNKKKEVLRFLRDEIDTLIPQKEVHLLDVEKIKRLDNKLKALWENKRLPK
jgi:hypothetical protein